MSQVHCPSCGAPVAQNAADCRYCGAKIGFNQPPPPPQHPYPPQGQPQAYPYGQGQPYGQPPAPPYAQPQGQQPYPPYGQQPYAPYGQGQPPYGQTQPYYGKPFTKSKVAAALLGIFLGSFGIHKFYLGRVGWGIVYLLFCWTYIPALLGFIEGIIYLTMSDEKFAYKYAKR